MSLPRSFRERPLWLIAAAGACAAVRTTAGMNAMNEQGIDLGLAGRDPGGGGTT
jgi:hypothetical protein